MQQQRQSKKDKKIRLAAEKVLMTGVGKMSQKEYGQLVNKYGHDTLFKAFSDGLSALTSMSKRQVRFMALHRLVYRWRVRFERLLSWLEEGKRNANSS